MASKRASKVVATDRATLVESTELPWGMCIGRWWRQFHGATKAMRDKEAADFLEEHRRRKQRWMDDYGEKMPNNVDDWRRLLSRVGLSRADVEIVLSSVPDIDLVIDHIEGYFDRVYRDARRSWPQQPLPTQAPQGLAGRSPSDAEPATLAAECAESPPPALSETDRMVLQTMAIFDPSRLLSTATIAEAMAPAARLAHRTIGPIVRRLIELELAERPEGDRSGARLTMRGRRLASKIAD
jgi:hypothetical protein